MTSSALNARRRARKRLNDLRAARPSPISGLDALLRVLCAVFAETEVVGLLTRGKPREDVARAAHRAILQRAEAMLRRVDTADRWSA